MPKELRQRVIDFSGGENTRLSPYRIAENEGQVSTDTDSLSARLNPVNSSNVFDTPDGDYYFKNKWISDRNAERFEPFGNSLIISYLDKRPRFRPAGSPSASSDTITFDATLGQITSTTLNFEDIGFVSGHFLYVQGGDNDNKNFRVQSVSGSTITVNSFFEGVDQMSPETPTQNVEVTLDAFVFLGVPPAPIKPPSVSKKEITAGVSEAREKAYFYYSLYTEFYNEIRHSDSSFLLGNATTIDTVYFPFESARFVHQTDNYVHLLGYNDNDSQARITTYSIDTTNNNMTFVWTVLVDHYETEYKFFKNVFIGRNGENASVVKLNESSTPTVRNVEIFPTTANLDSFVNSSTFTVSVNNTFTCTNHGLSVGNKIRFSGASLASPLSSDTDYYVKTVADANSFTVTTDSDTSSGTELDITTTGTAPQTLIRIVASDNGGLSFENNSVSSGGLGEATDNTAYYATKWLDGERPSVNYNGFVANDTHAYFATKVPDSSYQWEVTQGTRRDQEETLNAGELVVIVVKDLGTGVSAEGWSVNGDVISTTYASINRGSGYSLYTDGGISNNSNIVIFKTGTGAKIQSLNNKGAGFDVYKTKVQPTTGSFFDPVSLTTHKTSSGNVEVRYSRYNLRAGTGVHDFVLRDVTFDCWKDVEVWGYKKQNCVTDWNYFIEVCKFRDVFDACARKEYTYDPLSGEWGTECKPGYVQKWGCEMEKNPNFGVETCDEVYTSWKERQFVLDGCTEQRYVWEWIEPVWDLVAGPSEPFDINGPSGWSRRFKDRIKNLNSTKIYQYRDKKFSRNQETPVYQSEWVHVGTYPTNSVSNVPTGVNYKKTGVMYFVTQLNLATGVVESVPLKTKATGATSYSATKQKYTDGEITFTDQKNEILNNFMGSKMIWRSTDKLKLRRGNTFSATDGLITEDSSMTLSDSNAKIYAVDTRGLNTTTQSASAVVIAGTKDFKVHTAMDNVTFPDILKTIPITAYSHVDIQYSYNNVYFVLTDNRDKGSGKLQVIRCNGEQANQNSIVIDQSKLFGDDDARKISRAYVSGISNSKPHKYIVYSKKSDTAGSLRVVDTETILHEGEDKEESATLAPFSHLLKVSGRTLYGAIKSINSDIVSNFVKSEFYFVSDFIGRDIKDTITNTTLTGTVRKILRKKGNNFKFHLLIEANNSGNSTNSAWETTETWNIDLNPTYNSDNAQFSATKVTTLNGNDVFVERNKAWFHSNDSGQVVAVSDDANTTVGVSQITTSTLVFTASSKQIVDDTGSGNAFTNFGVGQTFTVSGTGSNNATFTVATFTDASTITVNETVVDESNPTNAIVTPLITQEIRVKEAGQSAFNNTDWAVMRKSFSPNDTDLQTDYFSALLGEYSFSGSTRPTKNVLNSSNNTMNEVDWETGIFVWTNNSADQPYIYKYSYVNGDGLEGPPSPASDEIDLNDTDEYNFLDSFESPLPDDYIKKIRLYRVGGNTLDYKVVDTFEIPSGGISTLTIYDTKKEEELIALSPKDDAHPPTTIDNDNRVFKFITQVNGTFMAAEGGNVVFSEYGTPHSFPVARTKDRTVFRGILGVDSEITSMIEFNGECVVFTEGNVFKIRGFDFTSMHLQRVPDNQGLPKSYYKSLTKIKNMLVWANKNGICVFDGNAISVISQAQIGQFPSLENPIATVKDNVYHLFQNSSSLTARGMMVDFRLGRPVITGLSLKANTAFTVPETNTLYTNHGAFGEGVKAKMIFQSKEYDFGNLNAEKLFTGVDISYKNFSEDIGILNDNTVSFTSGSDSGNITTVSGAFKNIGVGDYIVVQGASTTSNNQRYRITGISNNTAGKFDYKTATVLPSPTTESAGSYITINRANDISIGFRTGELIDKLALVDGSTEVHLPYSSESAMKKNVYLNTPVNANSMSFEIKGTGSVFEVGVKALNSDDYKQRMLWMGFDVTYTGIITVGAKLDGNDVPINQGDNRMTLQEATTQKTTRIYFPQSAYGFTPYLYNLTTDDGFIANIEPIPVPEKYYRGLRDFTEGQITYKGEVYVVFYLDGTPVHTELFQAESNGVSTKKFYFPSGTRGNVFQYRQKTKNVDDTPVLHLDNYIISVETDQMLTDQEMPQQETPNG